MMAKIKGNFRSLRNCVWWKPWTQPLGSVRHPLTQRPDGLPDDCSAVHGVTRPPLLQEGPPLRDSFPRPRRFASFGWHGIQKRRCPTLERADFWNKTWDMNVICCVGICFGTPPRPASGRERSVCRPSGDSLAGPLCEPRLAGPGQGSIRPGTGAGTSGAHAPSTEPDRGAGHRSTASRAGPLGFRSFPGAASPRGGGGDAFGVALRCRGHHRLRDTCRLARGPEPRGKPRRMLRVSLCGAESWKPRTHHHPIHERQPQVT